MPTDYIHTIILVVYYSPVGGVLAGRRCSTAHRASCRCRWREGAGGAAAAGRLLIVGLRAPAVRPHGYGWSGLVHRASAARGGSWRGPAPPQSPPVLGPASRHAASVGATLQC